MHDGASVHGSRRGPTNAGVRGKTEGSSEADRCAPWGLPYRDAVLGVAAGVTALSIRALRWRWSSNLSGHSSYRGGGVI